MAYDLDWIFLQVEKHLEGTPSLSLTQLSTLIGVERHTLERAVKNVTAQTFRDFRNGILLKHARGLLRDEPHRTIKEVAFILGYRYQGSFSRFIRTETGGTAKQLKMAKLEEAEIGRA